MAVTGQCLCGSVSYTINDDIEASSVCHCKNCQRQSGSAFSVLFNVSDDQITIDGDLTTYEDTSESGNVVHRHFCNKCGSPIKSTLPIYPGMSFMKAGTLDDISQLKPAVHFWTKSAQAWVDIDADAPQFPGNPE